MYGCNGCIYQIGNGECEAGNSPSNCGEYEPDPMGSFDDGDGYEEDYDYGYDG